MATILVQDSVLGLCILLFDVSRDVDFNFYLKLV